MKLLKIFFTGLLISFLGSLPLGTLNVAAMQIAINSGISSAIYFSLGALLVEIIYVRFSLVGIDWVRKQKKIFRWLEWISFFVVLSLAIGSFLTAADPHRGGATILQNSMPRFLLGMSMSALNPMQIPFWFGWSTVLFTKKFLLPIRSHYNYYVAGIGTGTFIGQLFFILSGRYIIDRLNASQQVLNWFIGGVFAVTAVILLLKIIFQKNNLEKF